MSFLLLVFVGFCTMLLGKRIAKAWVRAARMHDWLDIPIPRGGGTRITGPGGELAATIGIIFLGAACLFVGLVGLLAAGGLR